MKNAVLRRREKPLKIERTTLGKAKILKFDGRARIIVLDQTQAAPKSGPIIRLVRDLLAFLRALAPVVQSPKRTPVKKPSRGRRQ